MREDSGVCQKRANFDIILGARCLIYRNWWQKRTNYKTGLCDRAQDAALLQLTLVMLLLLSRDNPPQVSVSTPHLRFCLWPSMIILSPGKSPEDFLFLVQQRVRCTHQKSSSAPVAAAGLLRVSYTNLLSFYSFQAMMTNVENTHLATLCGGYDPPSFI